MPARPGAPGGDTAAARHSGPAQGWCRMPPTTPGGPSLPARWRRAAPRASQARSEVEGMSESTSRAAAPDLLADLEAAQGDAAAQAHALYRRVLRPAAAALASSHAPDD